MKVIWISLALLTLPLLGFSQTNRIVCIGDSITQGSRDWQYGQILSYRYDLWKKLVDSGVAFDFVGSTTNNHEGNITDVFYADYRGLPFDRDHEGHWNWRADEVASSLPVWLQGYDADIALIHLGSNDQYKDQSHASTSNELGQVIGALRADNPAIKILLCQIIPWFGRTNQVSDLNVNYIAPLALAESTAQSPVILVDQYTGYDFGWIMNDTAHPTDEGAAFMAANFYDALRPILDGLVDEDGDEMHDQWELDFFGDLSHEATNRTDADAYSDFEEYVMGSDPTNALSALNFSATLGSNGLFNLGFQTVSGRQYRLESTDVLTNLFWETSVLTNGVGGSFSVENEMNDSKRYYRVKVNPL